MVETRRVSAGRVVVERVVTERMVEAIRRFSLDRGVTIDSFVSQRDVGKAFFVGTQGDGEIGLQVKASRAIGDTNYRRFLNAANGIVREICWIHGKDYPDKQVFPSVQELDECLSDKILQSTDDRIPAIIIGALFGVAEVNRIWDPEDLQAVQILQEEMGL